MAAGAPAGATSVETVLDDGTVLSHLEAGQGPPVLLLPGWSQTAAMFRNQLASLARDHRVLALDHRGHGASSTPATGYHLHRLAADVRAVLASHVDGPVAVVAHSAGCAVAWSYLELYGSAGLSALVLVDQMACALRNPAWTDAEAADAGATMDPDGLFAFTDVLRGDGEDPRPAFLEQVTSDGIGPELLAWVVEENLRFDRTHAAELIFDVATHDWRPLLAHVDVPTLVVAGDSVNVPIASQRWIAGQVPGARFAVVRAPEGGTHFPFLEAPDAFDAVVGDALAG